MHLHSRIGWWLPNLAGGDLQILLANRIDDIFRINISSRHSVGIQPDPHAVVAFSQKQNVADTWQSRQDILDIDGGVIAHVDVIVFPGGGYEVDREQHIGGLLLDINA